MTRSIVFGSVEIRPLERQLLVQQQPVVVGARAFDLLLALVERRDRVVSKTELLDLAWPGLVVEENNLSVQVSALRKLLGPAAIATVPGRGYRFVEPAKEAAAAPALAAEAGDRIVRRLAAVVFADLLDWAGTLVAHPEAAVGAWKALRAALIEPQVPACGGRILELAAEGLWVEFASTVDAIRWAVDLRERIAGWPAPAGAPRLQMRFAIHVDDVIVDDGKLIGDAAQVASRLLDGVAAAQIVVTEAARSLAGSKLPVRFRPLGVLKLRTADPEPTAIYAAEALGEHLLAAGAQPHLLWERRPSLAVLPFAADGGADQYFGDGMTEEIIALLSANRALFVIARNSTLRYSGTTAGPAEIAAELGVRYLLTGSVRRAGERLRIVAQLVEAGPGRVIWADRIEGANEDLFSFQARIAASIAAAIDPRVQEAEIERVCSRPTESASAYDCVLRGLALQYTFREGDFEAAGQFFRRAIELDPRYAQAHAHLAWWHNLRFGEGRSPLASEDGRQAEALSQRALDLDPRDALSLSVAGHIQSFLKRRFQVAMEMFDQALELNPSCAVAWARSGTTLAYLGQGEEALQRVRNAIRLSPFDPLRFAFYTTNGTACLVVGRDDEAAGWLGKARRLNPGYRAALRMLVAALALSGDREEARALAQEFMQIEPGFRVSNFASWYPLCEPHLARLVQGMRLGGLPN
ncbi:MAG: winged helix-turn-helix domain-containing protein [Rubrivivax sp.]|nr:winged helix-turn-helix domain-containing protein [Rubrivivax sp.]